MSSPLPNAERRTFTCPPDGSRWPYLVQTPPTPVRAVLIYLHGHYSDQYQGMTTGIYEDAFGKLRRELLLRSWAYVCPFYGGNSWMGPLAEAGMAELIGILRREHPGVPVHLMGGSMGGSSAMVFASRRAALLDGVAARCPACDIEAYYAFARASDNGTLQNIADAIRIHYTAGERNLAEELAGRSALANAGGLTIPVHLVHGSADTVIPVDATRELAKRLKGLGRKVRYHEIAGGHHDSPILEVDWAEMLDFLGPEG